MKILLYLICSCSMAFASGASNEVVIQNWTKDLLALYANANGLISSWGPSNGGYIFRSEIDLNGDGIEELLISSSMDHMTRSDEISVYGRKKSGEWQAYSTLWNNRPFCCRPGIDENGNVVIANEFSFHESGLYVVQFKDFDVLKITIPYRGSDFDKDHMDFVKYKSWPLVQIPVYGIKLSDYVIGRNNWKLVDFHDAAEDPNGCFMLKEDAEEMRANTAFTPQVANETFNEKFSFISRNSGQSPRRIESSNSRSERASHKNEGNNNKEGFTGSIFLRCSLIVGVLFLVIGLYINIGKIRFSKR